jgi:hypothetical protein
VYKYYKVEAVCEDGQKLQIDKVKKVKVGPEKTIILLILIAMFMYLLVSLYRYTR